MNKTSPRPAGSSRPRVQALVALRLLEVIKAQDAPPEVLEDENPSVTMPRRLGLSGVVDRQIRTYQEEARRKVRVAESEILDLFRLVVRRPDDDEIFERLGGILAEADGGGWKRRLPRGLAYALARRKAAKRLKWLFGRRIGGFGRGGFSMEGRSHLFLEADPGGHACSFVSGLCEAILSEFGPAPTVAHTLCQARGDALCRWDGLLDGATAGAEPGQIPADATG